ncbi:PorT family protein [Flavobacterium sp. J372]|uniref:porin family protein n=1 Tax=Flavobacterium sp. J372 TaxID=2898436 RepID=UPI0021507198|nr:porin family protein [Flavobacterium sp. J372]MCR5863170.1 PorT family protein [Flavobacterium sp. J372]
MKRLLLTAAVILGCCTLSNAQAYGIKAGVNFASFRGDDSKDFNVLIGWQAGGLAELKVFDHLSVQAEFLYSRQGAEIKDEKYELNYLTLPVVAKIYLTDSFNIQGGPQFGLLIDESDNVDRLESNTYDFGIVGGLEFFVADGLFIQARYNAGLSRLSDNSDLKNSVVSLGLGYIF